MPHGERFQGVLAPAAPSGGAFSIRKQVIANLDLSDYARIGGFEDVKIRGPAKPELDEYPEIETELASLLQDASPEGVQRALDVRRHKSRDDDYFRAERRRARRRSSTRSSKRFPIPSASITIEDTRELQPAATQLAGACWPRKARRGSRKFPVQDLLESSLRLRPDRLFLGEIRGAEAATFLQAVNTGHPGSLTTLHADSCHGAFERLALMTLQSDLKLTKSEIMEYVRSVVPMVVQLRRRPTRGVVGNLFSWLRRKRA